MKLLSALEQGLSRLLRSRCRLRPALIIQLNKNSLAEILPFAWDNFNDISDYPPEMARQNRSTLRKTTKKPN